MLTAHLRIADVCAVHGEGRFDSTLTVDSELLGEVGGAVGIRHGAGREEKQLAEISFVQRQFADDRTGELFASGGVDLLRSSDRELATA